MNKLILFLIITFAVACSDSSQESNFRKEVNRIKKEELPQKDYTLTSYDVDTLDEVRYTSEIQQRSNQGQKSVKILTTCSVDGKQIAELESQEFLKAEFAGQKILQAKDGSKHLIYAINTQESKLRIFKLQYDADRLVQTEIEKENELWQDFKSKMMAE